jgi:hypothetical protein
MDPQNSKLSQIGAMGGKTVTKKLAKNAAALGLVMRTAKPARGAELVSSAFSWTVGFVRKVPSRLSVQSLALLS